MDKYFALCFAFEIVNIFILLLSAISSGLTFDYQLFNPINYHHSAATQHYSNFQSLLQFAYMLICHGCCLETVHGSSLYCFTIAAVMITRITLRQYLNQIQRFPSYCQIVRHLNLKNHCAGPKFFSTSSFPTFPWVEFA